MITGKHILTIDSHTAGEATRIVVSGVKKIPGVTIMEKKKYLSQNMDNIRTMLMHEPRGHKDMFGSLLVEPVDPRADYGIIFMDSGSYLHMCGHGSIGAVTVILEMGFIPMIEPLTQVILETPAGLVYCKAIINNGSVKEITIRNVDSFLYQQDIAVEIPEVGTITVDIAFGGNFFALVDVGKLGMDIIPQQIDKYVEMGMSIREQVNRKIKVEHPLLRQINSVDLVELYGLPRSAGAQGRNVVIFGNKQFDRSPCGTGTSAKLATLFAQGQLSLGEDYINESIINTTFRGRVIQETKVGAFPAVTTEISGRAFITGIQQFVYNPEDPVKFGFLVQ